MKPEKIDPIMVLLAQGIVFFTVAIFLAEIFFYKDSQIFQVVSQAFAGLVGAFLAKIKSGPPTTDPTSTSTTVISRPTQGGGIATETTHIEAPIIAPEAGDK